MSGPLVSVITIFLNPGRFFGEAIESVLAQTYPDWELLLVDDGSSDGSTELARMYAARHPAKVWYLEHEGRRNLGMSASRNRGVAEARGEYVAFLDADDVWLPEKLERQVAILRTQLAAAMVYGPALYWYGWNGRLKDARRDFTQRVGIPPNTLVHPPNLLVQVLRDERATPSPSGILARKEIIRRVGGFEESFRGMYEDQVFYVKVGLEAPVFVAQEGWYRYRQHPDACVSVAARAGTAGEARRWFLQWALDYAISRGPDAAPVRPVLHWELWKCRHPVLARAARLPGWLGD